MFSVADLIERAKARANLESDYRLCKVIGINQSALGNYSAGRSLPSDKVLTQLCALSGDDVALVVAQIHADRATDGPVKLMWTNMAKRLAGGASTAILSVLFAIGFIAISPLPVRASDQNSQKISTVEILHIVSTTIQEKLTPLSRARPAANYQVPLD